MKGLSRVLAGATLTFASLAQGQGLPESREAAVLGTIAHVESHARLNEFGDEWVESLVVLRTKSGEEKALWVSGGSIGELTVEVSGEPFPRVGDVWQVKSVGDRGREIHSLSESTKDATPLDSVDSLESPRPAPTRWSGPTVEYYVNPENHDVTVRAALAAVRAGAEAWSAPSHQASIELVYAGATTAKSSTSNRRNEIIFRDETSPYGPSVTAVTLSRFIRGVYTDADIIFWDGAKTFFTGTTGCVDGFYIEDTATHEFGHFLGLKHSDTPRTTMYGRAQPCSGWRRFPSPLDIAALRALYPR